MMLAEIQLESITAVWRCLDPSHRGFAVTHCGGFVMVMIATTNTLMVEELNTRLSTSFGGP